MADKTVEQTEKKPRRQPTGPRLSRIERLQKELEVAEAKEYERKLKKLADADAKVEAAHAAFVKARARYDAALVERDTLRDELNAGDSDTEGADA